MNDIKHVLVNSFVRLKKCKEEEKENKKIKGSINIGQIKRQSHLDSVF